MAANCSFSKAAFSFAWAEPGLVVSMATLMQQTSPPHSAKLPLPGRKNSAVREAYVAQQGAFETLYR